MLGWQNIGPVMNVFLEKDLKEVGELLVRFFIKWYKTFFKKTFMNEPNVVYDLGLEWFYHRIIIKQTK